MVTRAAICSLAVVLCGVLAGSALAAKPAGPGTYSGPTGKENSFVRLFVDDKGRISGASITYGCKGRPARRTIGTSARFKPVPVPSSGAFEIRFRGPVRDFQGKRLGRARVRVAGRFRTRRRAPGVARVRSRGCDSGRLRFVAEGPRAEG